MKRLLLILLLFSAGSVSAQEVLFICTAQLPCPGFPLGSVQAGIDQNGWRHFKLTLTQNVTLFSFVGTPPPAQAVANVIFTQDGVGGRTITFASNITNACMVGLSANATTMCEFEFDGTTGSWIGISTGGAAAAVVSASTPFVPAIGTTIIGLQNQKPSGTAPVWNRMGVVINPGLTNCGTGNSVQEHAILYEGNAQILTGSVFKMWYHAGFTGTPTIYYAESTDGLSWTCFTGNPIISGHTMPRGIIKNGNTYILYLVTSGLTQIDRYTSTNGTSWTLANSAVLAVSGAGWDSVNITNPTVWFEGPTTWYMLYFSNPGSPSQWEAGLATSSDGITWTKSGSNPVIAHATGSCGIYKSVGGTYYCWTQQAPADGATLPSDIGRWTSTNLTSWTNSPSGFVYTRGSADEGFGNPAGQAADPAFVTTGNGLAQNSPAGTGKVFMYYEGLRDQQNVAPYNIKLAIANMTMEQLITTNEGAASVPTPDTSNAVIASPIFLPTGAQNTTNGDPISLGVGFEPGAAGYISCGNLTSAVVTPYDHCTWGMNAFTKPSTLHGRGNTTISGPYFEMHAGTNTASYISGGEIDPAGTDHFMFAADLNADNSIGRFYLGPKTLCFNSNGAVGTCNTAMIAQNALGSLQRFSLGSTSSNFAGILHDAGVLFQETANPCSNISAGQSIIYQDSTIHLTSLCDNAFQTASPLIASWGTTSQKTESAADASLLSITPPAVVASYRACFQLDVSAASAATLGWTMTWTDSNGTAQTPTNLALTQNGTAAPALTFTTSAAGDYNACQTISVNSSGTAIVVKLTFSGTSFTAKASASIERLL